MTNDKFWSHYQKIINQALDDFLPKRGKLAEAMRYSVFAGGKRFRPGLCFATAKIFGVDEKKILPFACAVEMLHTFTLIHDDLPAMDNADLRRGKPACHIKYGEALAILAGDALNTLAFKIIADYPKAAKELAISIIEVIEGQVLDLQSIGQALDVEGLEKIHDAKTGALLCACVRGTALICQAKRSQLNALTSYATHLGLAFQIADDILDATATSRQLGKPAGADQKKGFPYLIGIEKSKELALQEKEKAVSALKKFGKQAARLQAIAGFVVNRGN